jgi:hypothetical protein
MTKIEPVRSIIVKTVSTENKERILMSIREKCQITYKGNPPKITADFSTENIKIRRAWNDIFQSLKENNCKLRIPHKAFIHN